MCPRPARDISQAGTHRDGHARSASASGAADSLYHSEWEDHWWSGPETWASGGTWQNATYDDYNDQYQWTKTWQGQGAGGTPRAQRWAWWCRDKPGSSGVSPTTPFVPCGWWRYTDGQGNSSSTSWGGPWGDSYDQTVTEPGFYEGAYYGLDYGGGEAEYFDYLGDAFSNYPGSDTGLFPSAQTSGERLGEPPQQAYETVQVFQAPEESHAGIPTWLEPLVSDSVARLFSFHQGNWWELAGNKVTGVLDRAQSQIWIESSDGRTYEPQTAREFLAALREIEKRGASIRRLVIKGHGSSDPKMINLGDDGYLVLSPDGRRILIDGDQGTLNEDITLLLRRLVDADSIITFRGCTTLALAN